MSQSNQLAPYPDYKDSGVAWLGDIPSHWEIWKINHIVETIGSGTTPKSSNEKYYGEKGVLWVTTSELRETIITDTKKKLTEEAIKAYGSLKIFPKNSVAIAMYGATIGRLGVLGKKATFNQACCVYKPSKLIHFKFLYYWLWYRRPILISLSNGGGQPNLNQDELTKLKLPLPPKDEQQAIVDFLDHQLNHIDTLISKQQQLLDKLAEQRSALITHAVTKGLDPNAPMKYSGVEWLGDIPEHWEVKSLRYIIKDIGTGSTPPTNNLEYYEYFEDLECIDWFNPSDFNEATTLINSKKKISRKSIEDNVVKIIPKNSILLVGIGATLGKVGIVNYECTANQQINYITLQNRQDSEFIMFALKSQLEIMKLYSSSSTLGILNQDKTKSLVLSIPPVKEQKQIVDYLDTETQKIDQISQTTQNIIDKLQEYRSALITQAVTGKIDVRGFEADLNIHSSNNHNKNLDNTYGVA